jgi:hypothetical protein
MKATAFTLLLICLLLLSSSARSQRLAQRIDSGDSHRIARNADNGDAWEWINEPRYPLKFGLAAYRLGMNVIVYAMTR